MTQWRCNVPASCCEKYALIEMDWLHIPFFERFLLHGGDLDPAILYSPVEREHLVDLFENPVDQGAGITFFIGIDFNKSG